MDFRSIGVSGVLVLLVAGCAETGSQDESTEEQVGETTQAIAPVIKLKNKTQTKFFNGEVAATDAPKPDAPPECAAGGCDHVRVKVELPNGTFNNPNKPGGVQIAIRWFGTVPGHTLPPGVTGCCGEFDTLNLFVYKEGTLRGQSAGILSTGQSVYIPQAEDGYYDVWIAYDPTYNVNPSVEYEGLAEVEFEPKLNPVKRTLPDLTFRSTEVITFDTPSLPFFEPDPPPGSSCFVSEMDEDGAQNCLRFDQIIANVGRGPVEMEHIVPNGDVIEDDEEYPVTQRVYNSDGSFEDQAGAGTVEFHGVHGHFHYSSFANAELWQSNSQGKKLGNAPVRAAQKVSFCMADIRIDAWGDKGDGPRTYYAPDCIFPAFNDSAGDHYKQGIEQGWSDVYEWYVPDQYIEVTGVSNGYYLLKFCADPFNEIEEEDETNNCITNHIRLKNMGTPQQQAQVLGVVSGGNHHGHGDCDD